MRNYTAPSSRLLLAIVLEASSSLLGCFEPETHWDCFNPDCSPVDSGISGGGSSGSDAGSDAGASGSSGSGSGGGGASGTGGGAGSACMDCDADQVCDEVSGECVQCLVNGDCESPVPVCTVDHRCVACTLDRHCPSTGPACNDDNTCVGCTDSALHCGGDTPLCDVAQQECVQCLDNSDCTDPAASRCSDGICQPCTGPLHCDHLDDLGVCDASSGSGECVQCTGTSYEPCGTAPSGTPYVCDSLSRTCANHEVGEATGCETCVADAHCASGMACMKTEFGTVETGYYCLWKQDASGASAPNGDCLNVRPYIGTESSWTSIDGSAPVVCKPARTTCQAQSDFLNTTCAGQTADGHSECGADGIDDGYCAPLGPNHLCTVPCVSNFDCQDTQPGMDMECQDQNLGGQLLKVCQFQ